MFAIIYAVIQEMGVCIVAKSHNLRKRIVSFVSYCDLKQLHKS